MLNSAVSKQIIFCLRRTRLYILQWECILIWLLDILFESLLYKQKNTVRFCSLETFFHTGA
jgi:hypothetical protein